MPDMCFSMVAAVDDDDAGEHACPPAWRHALASLIGSRTILPHSRTSGIPLGCWAPNSDFSSGIHEGKQQKRRRPGRSGDEPEARRELDESAQGWLGCRSVADTDYRD